MNVIGEGAFQSCNSLTSVTILNSSVSIGNECFSYCRNLADVYFMGTEDEWNALTIGRDNGPLTGAAIHCLIAAPDFFLPAGLTAIESEAFAGVAAQAVVIPKNIQSISGDPFLTDAWYARLTD